MQQIHFRTVDEMLEFLPEDELSLVQYLRAIVFETIPDVSEHLAYNVPYYKRHANICFIWPGSVAWGSKTQPGVRFGFTRGHLLLDEIGYLDKGDRKQVFWRDFFELSDVDVEVLTSYIVQAVETDNELWIQKRRRR